MRFSASEIGSPCPSTSPGYSSISSQNSQRIGIDLTPAAQFRFLPIVEMLVRAGSDVNRMLQNGVTSILLALVLLLLFVAAQGFGQDVDGVFGVAPVSAGAAMAVWVPLDAGSAQACKSLFINVNGIHDRHDKSPFRP